MTKALYLLTKLILATTLFSFGVFAQEATLSEQSFVRGRQVIDDALKAHGGEALSRIDDFYIAASGTNSSVGESLSPAPPFGTNAVELSIIAAPKRKQMLFESSGSVPGGYAFHLRYLLSNGQGFAVDVLKNFFGSKASSVQLNMAAVRRFMPALFLQDAVANAGTLRWLREERDGSSAVEVVTYVDPENVFTTPTQTTLSQTVLYIDAQTKLIRRVEQFTDHPVFGDTELSFVYPQYRIVEGIQVPVRHQFLANNLILQDVVYNDVKFNTRPAPSVFELPIGYQPPEPSPPASIAVEQIADNVYLLKGVNGYGYIEPRQAMFITFKDYVMVIEGAPGNTLEGQRVIDKIREVVPPDRPIRYLVMTHPHYDHSGGARAYVAAGITIVTTPTGEDYLKTLVAAKHTIKPDALSRSMRPPITEIVNKKRVFTDGVTTVEFYDAGPTPHVSEELLAYFPKEKIMFQGDLLTVPFDGSIQPAPAVTVYFSEWLRRMRLSPERIYAVHSPAFKPFFSMDDLVISLEKARTSQIQTFSPELAQGSTAALESIIDKDAQVEKLIGGFQFLEGPVWHPSGFLYFNDIIGDTTYKWTPTGGGSGLAGKLEIVRHPSGRANGNTLDLQGRLISAEHERRVTRIENDGSVTTLAERYDGKRLNTPNDLVVKSDGSLYFSDPSFALRPPLGARMEKEELGFRGIYRLSPTGTLSLLVRDFESPNGLAFSPDEGLLYINDPARSYIKVFDVRKDGSLANGRVFAVLPRAADPRNEGQPDGLKIDAKGNVYCAGPGGIWVYAPDGRHLGRIATPEIVINFAFGNGDFKTLYIASRSTLYRVRLLNEGSRRPNR